jgi:choline dehydrogenase
LITDYIVVGAGAAGCVVAARLSEQRQVNVLLLEAGPADPGPECRVPIAWRKLISGTLDWGDSTVAEPYLAKKVLPYPQGKAVGGSTALFAGLYSRGDRHDYDTWRELGNPGWGWDYVQPYFEKCLREGLPVEPFRTPHPFTAKFLAANPEARLAEVMHRNGRKVTAADVYLTPEVKARPNLTILNGVNVVRVLLEGRRARGVEVLRDGNLETFRANWQVILSAGALRSPMILMRSGIGSAVYLEGVGIAPLVDLPGVGENLQDHVRAGVEFSSSEFRQLEKEPGLFAQMRYWTTGRGPMASPVVEAVRVWRGHELMPAPNLQWNFVPRRGGGDGFTIWTTLLRPFSRGYVRLRSADPAEGPDIHLNVLEEPEDRAMLEQGIAESRLAGAALGTAQEAVTYDVMWHACGTCRMGQDGMAVVDSNLKVHEVDGLRIVDASIMPVIPSGNTAAPALMIGERGADLVRC